MTAPSSLSRLLRPESIAIVGLSADSTKHGARVLSFLRRFGFEGTIWGVNPKTPQVAGVEVFAHLGELPFSPDALVLAVPAPVIPKVLEEAGVCGAGGAILFSRGFAEAGPEGAALQARVKEMALASGVRLLGPNSAGVIHPAARTVMSFLTCLERPAEEIHTGPVGLITQSGGVGSFIHNLAASRGSGLAISVSTGNEADIEAGEALSYLTDHPDVKVIALFLEVVRNGPRFLEAARAALGAGKPIVACKIGRSESGQRIMSTHTGALAGPERVYEAAFVSLGITVTRSPEELFEVAELMARSPRPAGAGVGIVTHSGGTAVMLADRAEELGVSLPTPSPQLQERLAPFLQFGATGNPADLGGIVTQPQRYAEGVRLFLEDPAYAAVVAVSTPHPPPHTPGRARALVELSRNSAKPVINLWLAGDQAEEGLHILREAGAPVTTSMDGLLRALHGLNRLRAIQQGRESGSDPFTPGREALEQLASLQYGDRHTTLTEADSKSVLRELGFNVVPGEAAADVEQALRVADTVAYPVVLKVVSPDIAHKSDAGGVHLNIHGPEELRRSWNAMLESVQRHTPQARVEGGLVEKYLPGIEMILGIVRDTTFGPMVIVGTGGVLAEALDDVSLGLAPVSETEAEQMIGALKGAQLLEGFRGGPPADVTELAKTLSRLSSIAASSGDQIEELDINPLVFSEGNWWAVDALIHLRPRQQEVE